MIDLLDTLIQNVLDTDWPASPPGPAKPAFYFTVPDDNWQTKVKAGIKTRLNIYLCEVRESVNFRRAEWDVQNTAGQPSVLSRPPAYLDCHYLISAWSPSEDSEATTPVEDEHALLAAALTILFRNPDVTPGAFGINAGGIVFQGAHIYLSIAPPEAPRVLNDFWSTMKLPWRPAIQLIVTAPLDLMRDQSLGPAVLTLVQRYAVIDSGGNPEEVLILGGWVLDATSSNAIADAIVQRTLGTGANLRVLEEARTDAQGRFVFPGLRGNIHNLNATATGYTDLPRTLDITTATINDHIFRMS
jgi:hypothetical protein